MAVGRQFALNQIGILDHWQTSMSEGFPDELKSAWKVYDRKMLSPNLGFLFSNKDSVIGELIKIITQWFLSKMQPLIVNEVTNISYKNIPTITFTPPKGFRKISVFEYLARDQPLAVDGSAAKEDSLVAAPR